METTQIVGFMLNGEEYALEIDNVQEIIKKERPTRVPRSKPYIIGVMNLRGIVMPIIDLYKRFELENKEVSETQRIIILNINRVFVGIVVDSVSEVIIVEKDQIVSNPAIRASVNQEYLRGVCKLDGERLLTLLNIEKILEIQE